VRPVTSPWTPDPGTGALALLPGEVPLPGPAVLAREGRARVTAEAWAAIVAHKPTQARYAAMTCRRGPGQCWHWTGAVDSSGHGSFRAGKSGRTVIAHVYGWHLLHGPALPGPAGEALVISHGCDESGCQNPAHWKPATPAENAREYAGRRGTGPLTDRRGAAGRARAIGEAIREAIRSGASPQEIEAAIARASAAGMPAQAVLF
jgi:hypothetical protein